MKTLLHTGKHGNKSVRENKTSSNLCVVEFVDTMGMTQSEIVKYQNRGDLNRWINQYKASYRPNASHSIKHINEAKITDTINIA